MVPDVVQDNITDAAKRLGFQFTEQVFYRAALEAGFTNTAEDKARQLDVHWKRSGYSTLPPWVKDFVLRACAGEVH